MQKFFLALAVSSVISLHGMEQDAQPLSFDIESENYSLRFRAVEQNNLYNPLDESEPEILKQCGKTSDNQRFTEFCGDYEMLKSTLGWFIASAAKAIYLVSPSLLVEEYIRHWQEAVAKMPEDKKILHYWIIENRAEGKENDYVGLFILATYVEDRSEKYANEHLLEVIVGLAEPYRGLGISSQCWMKVLEKLKTFEQLSNAYFCFAARPDNERVNRIVEKFSVTKDCSSNYFVKLGGISYSTPYNLFVIDKS